MAVVSTALSASSLAPTALAAIWAAVIVSSAIFAAVTASDWIAAVSTPLAPALGRVRLRTGASDVPVRTPPPCPCRRCRWTSPAGRR